MPYDEEAHIERTDEPFLGRRGKQYRLMIVFADATCEFVDAYFLNLISAIIHTLHNLPEGQTPETVIEIQVLSTDFTTESTTTIERTQ